MLTISPLLLEELNDIEQLLIEWGIRYFSGLEDSIGNFRKQTPYKGTL